MKKKRKSLNNTQNGFTLLEILIVLGIIVAIMAIVAQQVFGKNDQANVDITKTQITNLQGGIVRYLQSTKQLPNSLQDLITAPGGVKRWVGPYAQKQQLQDPWGNDIQYKKPGAHGQYDIYSFGADGKPGGSGVNADIGNWD